MRQHMDQMLYQRRMLGDLWRLHLTKHTWEPVFTCGNLPGPRCAFGAHPPACAHCAGRAHLARWFAGLTGVPEPLHRSLYQERAFPGPGIKHINYP